MRIEGLDNLDNQILEIVKENARLGYTEIGKQIGLSRVSVKTRMDNMEKNGIIKGYHTIIDPTAVPNGIRFFINIEADPEYYEDVVEMLSFDKRVRQIYSTTGSSKIHAEGLSPSQEDVGYFARNLFQKRKGIKRLEWDIITSVLKDVDGGVEYVRYQKPEHLETGQSD